KKLRTLSKFSFLNLSSEKSQCGGLVPIMIMFISKSKGSCHQVLYMMDKVKPEIPNRQVLGLMILLSFGYYTLSSWLSYSELRLEILLGIGQSVWHFILFWSGVFGLLATIGLLMPFSNTEKRILGYLLGVFAIITTIAWVLAESPTFLLTVLGVIQVIYYLFPKGFQYSS
ncbi:MAG: hypothetical protein ACFFCP_12995, partial [Promethearchaeota archaeon]